MVMEMLEHTQRWAVGVVLELNSRAASVLADQMEIASKIWLVLSEIPALAWVLD